MTPRPTVEDLRKDLGIIKEYYFWFMRTGRVKYLRLLLTMLELTTITVREMVKDLESGDDNEPEKRAS